MSASTATRTEIIDGIGKIEMATRSIHVERKAMVADAMERRRLTFEEVIRAVEVCVEQWEGAFFPPTAKILGWARPVTTNAPQRELDGSRDPIIGLEREIALHTEWLRIFEQKGDAFRSHCARVEIEGAQKRINNRLQERGLSPRYVAVGVELFGAEDTRSKANRPVQANFGDWPEQEYDRQ